MSLAEHRQGLSSLLKYSLLADQADVALDRFQEDRSLTEHDMQALEGAVEFLRSAQEAEKICSGVQLRGFSAENVQLRKATYAAAARVSTMDSEALVVFLQHFERVLTQVRECLPVTQSDVGQTRQFLQNVRRVFQANVSGPIERVLMPS